MDSTILEAAMTAIGSAFGREAATLSVETIKQWFAKAGQSVEDFYSIDNSELETLANEVLSKDCPAIDAEFKRKNLARWFEIPQEEFARTPPSQLEPEVLIRHLYLEDMFRNWLKEWGYETFVGEDLEGRESIDFTPDVYGRLRTLHGDFEICVNFVCDDPPSQYRVRALLETLEAYATEASDFKWGDIYILATPFQFGRGTTASIRLQSKEEKYTVLKLEGDDISQLKGRSPELRLARLTEHVDKAKAIGPQPK